MNRNVSKNPAPAKSAHVCPWWFCFTFDNALRKLFHKPDRLLSPYVNQGSTVLDIGAGRGYFTIQLAELVGAGGKVIAADLQQEMLTGIYKRALKSKMIDRIVFHRCTRGKIGLSEALDFCLVFWMLHEVPDKHYFLNEITALLKPGGTCLLVEPKLHVTWKNFLHAVETARAARLAVIDWPPIRLSYAVLLQKNK